MKSMRCGMWIPKHGPTMSTRSWRRRMESILHITYREGNHNTNGLIRQQCRCRRRHRWRATIAEQFGTIGKTFVSKQKKNMKMNRKSGNDAHCKFATYSSKSNIMNRRGKERPFVFLSFIGTRRITRSRRTNAIGKCKLCEWKCLKLYELQMGTKRVELAQCCVSNK